MGFRYSDPLRQEYFRDGLTVLRGIIPPSLLTDLRRESERARVIARERSGPQAQRLQPVYAYEELRPQPFADFLNLPDMRTVVDQLLSPDHQPTKLMGILLEPAEKPWCTHWHRDWGYNVADLDMDAFFAACKKPQMFNQLNGALYDDHSLWVVPGSHDRVDTPEETAAFSRIPPPGPDLESASTDEARERLCHEYIRQMPGAVPVPLLAGDVAFYRACGWHIGVYVPYTKRATLHDGYYGADDWAWRDEVPKMQERVRAAKV